MRPGELERKLKALHESSQRISVNLLELEIDSGRELLELSALEGESAAMWSPASAALTELWRRQSLLEDLLARANKLRSSWRAADLRALLEGPSIELARSDVPLAERSLLGGSQAAERCTPDELIAKMSSAFDEVKVAVSAIGAAWQNLIPKLDAARQLLREADRLAGLVGGSGRGALRPVAERLVLIEARVSTDPLSVALSELDGLADAIRAIREDLEATAALKRGFQARMMEARERLEQAGATLREAQSARGELVAKIAGAEAPRLPSLPEELEGQMNEIGQLAEAGEWREARAALEHWSARADAVRDEARRALQAFSAPIEERNRLRALLEAYQVKAKRRGLLEHPEIEPTFTRAHDVLFTAPTDLVLAAKLVGDYQRALRGSGSATEEATR